VAVVLTVNCGMPTTLAKNVGTVTCCVTTIVLAGVVLDVQLLPVMRFAMKLVHFTDVSMETPVSVATAFLFPATELYRVAFEDGLPPVVPMSCAPAVAAASVLACSVRRTDST